MKELEKAIKTYWYSRGFNKAPDTGGWYQMELDAFSEGWKQALEWVANKCRGRRSRGLFDLLEEIDRELDAKT